MAFPSGYGHFPRPYLLRSMLRCSKSRQLREGIFSSLNPLSRATEGDWEGLRSYNFTAAAFVTAHLNSGRAPEGWKEDSAAEGSAYLNV